MSDLRVHLFGKFRIDHNSADGMPLAARKCRSLFYFLLLYKNRPHLRDNISALLWNDLPIDQSRKHLRQALWQLQKGLSTWPDPVGDIVLAESDWIQINPDIDVWVDAIEFDRRCSQVRRKGGRHLHDNQGHSLQVAVDLYSADLLENCHDDWCLIERERFRHMYMASLDKLMAFHVQRGEYNVGIEQGLRALSHNPVREQTYRWLMRVFYLNGDRPAALRLFTICEEILERELMLKPSAKTIEQYRQIRDGGTSPSSSQATDNNQPSPTEFSNSSNLLEQLRGLQSALIKMQREIEDHIRSIESPLR